MKRTVIETFINAKYFFEDFKKEVFGFDTETTSLKYLELDIEGCSFCDGKKVCYIDLIDNPEKEIILNYLCTEIFTLNKILIAHNIVFDLKVLKKYGIIPQSSELFCTMIADHLLDENKPHGLKHIAKELLGHETKDYDEIKDHKSQEFYDYAMNDAVWTWEISQIYKERLKQENLTTLFRDIEMPFQWSLVDMETNGFLIDKEKVNTISEELNAKIEDLTVELLDITETKYEVQMDLFGNTKIISPINFNSTLQLTNIIQDKLGLTIEDKTPSGAPSIGKTTLGKLKGKHPFIDKLVIYKIANKLLNGFFEPLPGHIDVDGRVRPSFNDIGARTGRLSCSKPNLQQLPNTKKELPISTRSCFIAEKGSKILTCDFSGQELRVLADLSGEESMIDAFNNGKDFHLTTANDFFNLGIKEEDLYEGSDNYEKIKEEHYKDRSKAKAINFGMAYGKGAYGFSKDFNITEPEAEEILKKYFAALPKVKCAIDNSHKNVNRKGFVRHNLGRVRRFIPKEIDGNKFYPKSSYRQAFNFMIQGYSADMMRIALNKVRKECSHLNIKLLACVHDEGVWEVKEEDLEEAKKEIKRCFEECIKLSVPVKADIGVGDDYDSAK